MKTNQDAFYENERLEARIAELEDAARVLLDSMFLRGEPGLTLPPTNSSVDKLRELLGETHPHQA